MKRWTPILTALAAFVAQPLAAEPPVLAQAIQAGRAGERYDGYLAVVGAVSPELKRQVNAINIRRRKLYIQLSERRNVTAELAGMATACQLLQQLQPGEAYMLEDGVWRRHAPGQPVALPNYCR